MKDSSNISVERIDKAIYLIRGEKVMLDADLAHLYGVTTARLNQQVNRNPERFPADFMFQLTAKEFKGLMLQTATSKKGRGGRRKLPLVFTEHGAIMAANVLNSARAIQAAVEVVDALPNGRATAPDFQPASPGARHRSSLRPPQTMASVHASAAHRHF